MNSFLLNWKTTAGGAATVLLGVLSLLGVKVAGAAPIDPQIAMGMITGGLALIFAKDSNVTGGTKSLILVGAILGALTFAPQARAADLAVKAINNALTSPTPCVVQNCSGWYGGFGVLGDGSNADIVGNGLNGSVFAAGGAIKAQGGYQFWNGSWFAALDLGVGYEFTTNVSANAPVVNAGGSKFIGLETVKLGYNFFPSTQMAPVTPSTSPVQALAPANILSNTTPYFRFGGMQRKGVNMWVNGAGVQTVIAANWTSDVSYLYAPAQQGLPATSVVLLELNRHF
jgi:opacity protein-like surface antigen